MDIYFLLSNQIARKVLFTCCANTNRLLSHIQIGSTALHQAAEGGHVEVARELLDNKAYVNVKTKVDTQRKYCCACLYLCL